MLRKLEDDSISGVTVSQGSLPMARSTGGVLLSPCPAAGTLPAGKRVAVPLFQLQGMAQAGAGSLGSVCWRPLPFQPRLSSDLGTHREVNVPQAAPWYHTL